MYPVGIWALVPSVYSIFLEDEFGELIPSAVQDSVRDNATSFWNGMHNAGNTLQTFSHTSLEVKDKFRSTLEGKHPWLRLCEENWKVNQVWRNSLGARGGVPGWYTANTLQGHGQSTHHIPTWALEVHS